MKAALTALFIVLSAGRAVAASDDVSVRSRVDRTAIWVGDRVTFTIELTCARGTDILAGDLSRDKLRLEGLDIVGIDLGRRSGPDEVTTYEVRYELTTYRVDLATLRIAPLTVRYYVKRPGQRLEEAAPAGEVQAPGASIAFRSVLADDREALDLRTDRPPLARPMPFAVLGLLGLGLVMASIVPAVLMAIAAARRRRPRRPRRSARQVRHDARASLDAVRAVDLTGFDGRREAFTHLDTLVREHLRNVCGIPAPSLTSGEVAAALSARGTRMPIELVTSVLAACELARYAPPDLLPSADACRQTIEQADQALAVER